MKLKKAFTRAVLGVVAAGAIMSTATGCGYYDETTVRAVVNDKGIKTESSGDDTTSTYMIYTSEGVFTNEDTLVKHKFNSSDVYNLLKVGCTYDFNVYGWRNHAFSSYKNIAGVKFVPTPECPTAPKIG